MFNDPHEVLNLIQSGDRVLDVGGAAEVFPRANSVIDIIGYNQRVPGPLKDMAEQFTCNDWYTGDICTFGVWENFKDKEFDFAICSHVLEDVRDPLYVCSQLIRVAKAGYIEVPSRFRECGKIQATDLVAGWEHHRWIVDIEDDTLVFTFKNPWIHRFDYLDGRRELLNNRAYQFTSLHWIRSFDFVERSHKGSPLETENLFYFYENYPYESPPTSYTIRNVTHRGKTFQWITDFRLPVEKVLTHEEVLKRYYARLSDVQRLPGQRGAELLNTARAAWRKIMKK